MAEYEFKLHVGSGTTGGSATLIGPDGETLSMAIGSSASECALDVLNEAADTVPGLVRDWVDGDVPEPER